MHIKTVLLCTYTQQEPKRRLIYQIKLWKIRINRNWRNNIKKNGDIGGSAFTLSKPGNLPGSFKDPKSDLRRPLIEITDGAGIGYSSGRPRPRWCSSMGSENGNTPCLLQPVGNRPEPSVGGDAGGGGGHGENRPVRPWRACCRRVG